MCGIFGIVDFSKSLSLEELKKFTDSLHLRGPDNGGYKIWEEKEAKIGFGHRRLSIVDLSNQGNQPFYYKDLSMVYNGELYNHKQLKLILKEKGYIFSSSSDTEVVIKYIHCFGVDKALLDFNGMYAIALYDTESKTLKLVRDRLGVKPLYYSIVSDRIIFSSEIKAILYAKKGCRILPESVANYLKFGYVPSPNTMWESIKKLEPGCLLSIDIGLKTSSKKQYWKYEDEFLDKAPVSLNELDKLINNSVSLRCDADVEVGCFLSGGYDSSLTAAIMQKQSKRPIKTFNIGFDNTHFDESSYAEKIAKHIGSEHYHMKCTPEFVKNTIKELPEIWDDPISDTSVFPTILVSKLARKHVKVALSSDGGDEIFAGYNVYVNSLKNYGIIDKVPLNIRKNISLFLRKLTSFDITFYSQPSRRLRRLSRILESNSPLEVKRCYQTVFDDDEVFRLTRSIPKKLSRNYSGKEGVNSLIIDDINFSHPDQLLTKVDRASMYSSLEAREPLLDIELVRYAALITENDKLAVGKGKLPLKNLAHRYLPKELLDRQKQGFSIPIKSWLENELSFLIDDYFSKENVKHNFLDNEAVEEILTLYKKGKNINFKQLWTLLSFQIWYCHWSEFVINDNV